MLNDKNLESTHLTERAKILLGLEMFKQAVITYTRSVQKLDAMCNVSHLAESLFIRDPSYVKSISCSCGYKVTRSTVWVTVNVDILMEKGLQHMQEAIDDAPIINVVCHKCKKTVMEERVYGPHLLIDVTVFTDKRYTTSKKLIRHDLESISTTVEAGNSTCFIAGVVDYRNEHYVAYPKSGMYWTLYNDIYDKRQNVKSSTDVKPHLIVYTKVHNNY